MLKYKILANTNFYAELESQPGKVQRVRSTTDVSRAPVVLLSESTAAQFAATHGANVVLCLSKAAPVVKPPEGGSFVLPPSAEEPKTPKAPKATGTSTK